MKISEFVVIQNKIKCNRLVHNIKTSYLNDCTLITYINIIHFKHTVYKKKSMRQGQQCHMILVKN